MSKILVVSSYHSSSSEIAKQLAELLDYEINIQPLEWHRPTRTQKVMDLFSDSDGNAIIRQVAEQLVEEFNESKQFNRDLILLSFGEGSHVVEEAMSIIHGLSLQKYNVTHIMLGPNIDDEGWSNIGKYGAAILALGLAGLALTQSKGTKKLASATLGVLGSAYFLNKTSAIEDVRLKTEEENFGKAKIKRHILHSIDQTNLPQAIQGAIYYQTDESIENLQSLLAKDMDMELVYTRRVMARKTEIRETKSRILSELLK